MGIEEWFRGGLFKDDDFGFPAQSRKIGIIKGVS